MNLNYEVGAIISVPKFPGVNHVGIVVGYNQVAHASPIYGKAKISTIEEFCGGQTPRLVRMSANPRQSALRAIQLINEGYEYTVTTSNCEHFICLCEGVKLESPQLAGWVLVGLVGLLVVCLPKK